jgi:glycosyltransferase involved in cell wall biosynthesis
MDLLSANISVIMPVFNARRYISAAVHSILQQSISATEFIIVDDASTDGTYELLQVFAEKFPVVKLLRLPEREGKERRTAKALNEALSHVTGNYIAWMDADDVVDSTRFEKQLLFLHQHPDIDACGTFAKTLSDNKRKDGRILDKPISAEELKLNTIWQSPFFQSSVMMRANSLGQHRYDETFAYAEDYEFFSRLTNHMNFANLPEPLLIYRLHSDQSITKPEFIIDVERILIREAKDLTTDLESHLCLFNHRNRYKWSQLQHAIEYADKLKTDQADANWTALINQALIHKLKKVFRYNPLIAFRILVAYPSLLWAIKSRIFL